MLGVPARRIKVRCIQLLGMNRGQTARQRYVGNHYTQTDEQVVSRQIDAELVHADAQDYWLEKQWFYCGARRRTPLMPSWDRFAQLAIMMSRPTERLVPEAAFRLMAVFLKLMYIDKIVSHAGMMLPLWTSANLEGSLTAALEEKGKKQEQQPGNDSSPPSAASSSMSDAPSMDKSTAMDGGGGASIPS